MMARTSTERQRNALKMAVRLVVEMCGGGKAVAPMTRVNETMLSQYAAPHESHRHAGVDVALDLDLAAGEPVIARALASLQGFDLVRTRPSDTGSALCLEDLSRLIREASDAQTVLVGALADRVITPSEKLEIKSSITDLRAVLTSIEMKVDEA